MPGPQVARARLRTGSLARWQTFPSFRTYLPEDGTNDNLGAAVLLAADSVLFTATADARATVSDCPG